MELKRKTTISLGIIQERMQSIIPLLTRGKGNGIGPVPGALISALEPGRCSS